MAGAKPGEQVVDLCAGGGGKTLALAAAMENHGQIYATDTDKRRLAPIHERLDRSGARNVQVRPPKSVGNELADLEGRIDLVLIDAPCTGTGSWRRNPDAKWRHAPGRARTADEGPGGHSGPRSGPAEAERPHRLCHLLGAGRGERRADPQFSRPPIRLQTVPPVEVIKALGERAFLFHRAVLISDEGLLMTPRRTDTDGFYREYIGPIRLIFRPHLDRLALTV